jgi:hypothetical protein
MRPASGRHQALAAIAATMAIGSAAAVGALTFAAVRGAGGSPDRATEDVLFDFALSAPSFGGGAVDDLDGDGDLEVVFGTYFNDERVIALHHDGTLLWEIPSGGGPVDKSVTLADLDADGRPEVLWGDSATTEFHVADAGGRDVWSRVIGEVLDAPEAIGDVDGDGALDIVLASCGSEEGERPGLRAFDGMSGAVLWSAATSGCYQSAPLLFDQDGDGLLDVVVSTWFDEKVRAFSGVDGSLRWETPIGGWTYHAGSFGDLDGDGVPDVALGDYSGRLWAIDGADGSVLWSTPLPGERYVFGPSAMGDLDGDGALEIVVAADALHVYGAGGARRFGVPLPAPSLRGPALTDLDGDGLPDIVVALDTPGVRGFSGLSGAELFARDFAEAGEAGFQPTIADLDGDGASDVFVVYGVGRSDEPQANWGRAVALPLGGTGNAWPTYSHDHHHSGNYEYPIGAHVNDPGPGPPFVRQAYLPAVRCWTGSVPAVVSPIP